MNDDEGIDFRKLEKELALAVEADAKYVRENDAKFRAVEQRVASYEEFRDIVSAAHLKPLERKDITGKWRKPVRSKEIQAIDLATKKIWWKKALYTPGVSC